MEEFFGASAEVMVVSMDLMQVREQLQLFRRASVVIAVEGGALDNIIFCAPGARRAHPVPRLFSPSPFLGFSVPPPRPTLVFLPIALSSSVCMLHCACALSLGERSHLFRLDTRPSALLFRVPCFASTVLNPGTYVVVQGRDTGTPYPDGCRLPDGTSDDPFTHGPLFRALQPVLHAAFIPTTPQTGYFINVTSVLNALQSF